MRRRSIIHLGLPKCGSSALQVRLKANVEKALELGALYPLQRTLIESIVPLVSDTTATRLRAAFS